MMTRVPTHFNGAGISMAEYVLIGSSVLLLCLAACMGFGKSLQIRLAGLKSDMAQHAQQAQTVQLASAQAHLTADITNSSAFGTLRISTSNPNQLCNNAFCVDSSTLKGSSVSTAGSNGNTNVIDNASNVFSRIAKILEAQGADPKTINLLTQLASAGHNIAFQQDWLNYDGSQRVNRTRLQVKTTNRWVSSDISGLRSALSNFKQLLAQLNATINDYPADVRPLLTDAANVVLTAGGSYNVWQAKNRNGQRVLKAHTTPGSVQTIHTNSNTICDNGGDQSQCHVGDY